MYKNLRFVIKIYMNFKNGFNYKVKYFSINNKNNIKERRFASFSNLVSAFVLDTLISFLLHPIHISLCITLSLSLSLSTFFPLYLCLSLPLIPITWTPLSHHMSLYKQTLAPFSPLSSFLEYFLSLSLSSHLFLVFSQSLFLSSSPSPFLFFTLPLSFILSNYPYIFLSLFPFISTLNLSICHSYKHKRFYTRGTLRGIRISR